MRITSKVILGYGLMIAIIISVHLYQASLMQEMLERQRQLTEVGFGTGMRSHRVFADLSDAMEFSLKWVASGDVFYRSKVDSFREQVDNDLHELLKINLFSGPLGEKTRDLVTGWNRCSVVFDQVESGTLDFQASDNLLQESCVPLLGALEELIQSGDDYLVATAAKTRESGERVTSVSRYALPVALVLSACVIIVVFRSISVSLKDMIRGAQRISEGNFEVHLRQDRGDELSELASVLNRMTRRLGELDRLKRDFVSHFSHDLRAPLASVEETTRLLLDECSDGLNPTQRRLLELSLSSSQRLSRLIGNLLDLSRIEAGVIGFDVRTVELKGVAQECLENLQGLFLDKGLKVGVRSDSGSCSVNADRARLARVIENLLSNAVEFSPQGGAIEVGVDRVRRADLESAGYAVDPDGPLCLLSVSDQGPGVPRFERERIFDQFYTSSRPDATVKKGGGTGLGLTIARRLVEAHDGRIWVEDNPAGPGSRFCILLRQWDSRNRGADDVLPQQEPELPSAAG